MLDVIYEDEAILVAAKPCGLPLTSAQEGGDSLLGQIKKHLKEKNPQAESFAALVHRLDRQAGGIVVAALDRKSAAELSRQVQSRELKRTFYAVARSCPRDKSGELTDYLIKDTATWRVRIAPRSTEGAKKAQLTYKVLQSVSCGEQTLTLLALRPATGIAHQMRVQLAGIGCPVWGDRVYGGGLEKKGSPTALWGVSTTLIHPVKGDKRTFLCYPQTDTPWKLFDIELAPDCSD